MRWGWGCSGELQKPPSTALGADSDSSNILSITSELLRGPTRFHTDSIARATRSTTNQPELDN